MQRMRTPCICLERTSCGGGNREASEEGHALQVGELPGLQCMQRMRTPCICLERTSCSGGKCEALEEGRVLQLGEQQQSRRQLEEGHALQLGEQQQLRWQLLEEGHALQLGEQQQLRRQLKVEAGEQHAAFGLLLPGLQCMHHMRTRCTCLERTSCGGGNCDLLIFALVLGGTHRSCVPHCCSCISICIHVTTATHLTCHASHDKHENVNVT